MMLLLDFGQYFLSPLERATALQSEGFLLEDTYSVQDTLLARHPEDWQVAKQQVAQTED